MGTVYIFYLRNLTENQFGNHTWEEYTSYQIHRKNYGLLILLKISNEKSFTNRKLKPFRIFLT